MKSLAFFALTSLASAVAMAGPTAISINGKSDQMVTVGTGSSVNNHASARTTAIQNISSNRGNITVSSNGKSEQRTTFSNNGSASNTAMEQGDIAIQNVASNYDTVSIKGKSEQVANVKGGAMSNTAKGGGSTNCGGGVDCDDNAKAMQNVSSNVGDVTVSASGKSTQNTSVNGSSSVANLADGKGAVAIQSLASNTGEVDISGKSEQTVKLGNTNAHNLAQGKNATAVQNLASNYDGVTISGKSEQTVTAQGGNIINTAMGNNTKAFQNLSSNFGNVTIDGTSTQLTVVKGAVMNTANGRGSVAVQNLASNDACEPPTFTLPSCPSGKCWTSASAN